MLTICSGPSSMETAKRRPLAGQSGTEGVGATVVYRQLAAAAQVDRVLQVASWQPWGRQARARPRATASCRRRCGCSPAGAILAAGGATSRAWLAASIATTPRLSTKPSAAARRACEPARPGARRGHRQSRRSRGRCCRPSGSVPVHTDGDALLQQHRLTGLAIDDMELEPRLLGAGRVGEGRSPRLKTSMKLLRWPLTSSAGSCAAGAAVEEDGWDGVGHLLGAFHGHRHRPRCAAALRTRPA